MDCHGKYVGGKWEWLVFEWVEVWVAVISAYRCVGVGVTKHVCEQVIMGVALVWVGGDSIMSGRMWVVCVFLML